MRDSKLNTLNANIFDRLKKLASLSFTNSKIERFSGSFEYNTFLTCLNISENYITEMNPLLLVKLKGLKNIAMTNNTNITMLPDLPSTQTSFKLDLSGNLSIIYKY